MFVKLTFYVFSEPLLTYFLQCWLKISVLWVFEPTHIHFQQKVETEVEAKFETTSMVLVEVNVDTKVFSSPILETMGVY